MTANARIRIGRRVMKSLLIATGTTLVPMALVACGPSPIEESIAGILDQVDEAIAAGRENLPTGNLNPNPPADAGAGSGGSRPGGVGGIADGSSNTINIGEQPASGGGAAADESPAGGLPANDDLAQLIVNVTAQLANKLFEVGSSEGAGGSFLTSSSQLGLCGLGGARLVETTIFATSTPTDFLDFDSTRTLDGVWSVVVFQNDLVVEMRDFPSAGDQPGAVLRRFTINLDPAGDVAGLNGSPLRAQNLENECAAFEEQNRTLQAVNQALSNHRVLITNTNPGAPTLGQVEIVLCESGLYGFKQVGFGGGAFVEGGTWSILLDNGQLSLELVSDPAFDANGQTFTTTIPVELNADGSVDVSTGFSTLEAINGDCEDAIATLIG